eukprot:TRINITY_DN104740_c0_g1_i1.p1 TRINITY_DN104740_c0_g1~~TRINITY_DN104740_c0_g1_i1.p1  ORF type:complete len:232 (+),score=27.29 TRINITY_DN104740_c0_g1_i1:70-765(+)
MGCGTSRDTAEQERMYPAIDECLSHERPAPILLGRGKLRRSWSPVGLLKSGSFLKYEAPVEYAAGYRQGDVIYDTNPTDSALRDVPGHICDYVSYDERGESAAFVVTFPGKNGKHLVPIAEVSRDKPQLPGGINFGDQVLYNGKDTTFFELAMDRSYLLQHAGDRASWDAHKLTRRPSSPLQHGVVGHVHGYTMCQDGLRIAVVIPGYDAAVLLRQSELLTDDSLFDMLFK